MKLITFISAGTFIFLSAFIMKKPANHPVREHTKQVAALYDTKWSLKKIHRSATVEEVNTKAFIQFNAERKSAGGNGSCNSFGSNCMVSGNTIRFSHLFSTKMYCEGVQQTEDSFFKQLDNATRFEIRDKSLFLYQGDDLLLEFQSE